MYQSCHSSPETRQIKKDSVKQEKVQVKSPIDSVWNAFAHYISGMHYTGSDSCEQTEFWKLHAAKTDLRWRLLMQNVGNPIENWVYEKKYLGGSGAPNTLIYPFAGGDFFYANLFFPNRDTIIMIGLESVGSSFDNTQIPESKMEDYLSTLDRCMFYPHKLGFFRTLSMDDDFAHEMMNGTLHTLLFYIVRSGFNIHYVTYFNLDSNGNFNDFTNKKINENIGSRIGYSKSNDKTVRELVYISRDISNAGNVKSPGTMAFLTRRGKAVSFMKAASYLMYKPYFSDITKIVLNQSQIILQDDSGMPLDSMRKAGFTSEVLGEYSRTIKLFSNYFQPSMFDEYASKKPAKLPFTIGYNAEFGECNLQLCVKK
ncbi:MAG: hypothetical protein CK532_07880 [Flavobacteriales bacterium]|nr:MAG: hypothetical protein CK532_07880 [Flavobacteriales bacterium]